MLSTSKRIIKNSIYMYIRIFIIMIISFYSSRLLLEKLGVEDFGIYNLIGSVVAMFSSLRVIFSSATQRFLNYEMGKDNIDNLPIVFNTSLYVNLFISIIFIILAEIIGQWFLHTKININLDRFNTVQWLFQFSIISAVINIMTVPYDAEIIAHERMDFYSIMSIIEIFLKFGIIFLLPIISYDRLFIYGLLLLIISIIIRIVNSLFCKKKFKECTIHTKWNFEYFKRMASFAGWNFLGISAFTLTHNGINMVMNTFGGPIVNAARGLAYQVLSALNQMTSNINVVITPYYTKTYASGDDKQSSFILYFSSKIFFFIQICLVIILTFYIEYIMEIWLIDVPMYACDFVSLTLLYSLIRSLHMPIDNLFKAQGNLKQYQIAEGIILTLPLIASYFLLLFGHSYNSVFISIIIFELLNLITIVFIAQKKCKLNIKYYIKNVILPCLLLLIIYTISYYINFELKDYIIYSILFTIFVIIISILIFLFICLNNSEKNFLFKLLKIKKLIN